MKRMTLCLAFACTALLATCGLGAQDASPAVTKPAEHLRSRIFIYSLADGESHLVYAVDGIFEAPNWSPDGSYLISNSDGSIYKLVLAKDGTATPEKLALQETVRCNNDKALSPDGKMLAFSASVEKGGSQVFLANADGSGMRRMVSDSPSYFHGWSPDGKTLAFVAQRGGSGQYDVYGIPVSGGTERQLNFDPHQDDGPDYSPDGKWIYINSDRSGKQAVWRFPATGAGAGDKLAQMVVSDTLQDWFPHPSPDGRMLLYIGYPTEVTTHSPRDARIVIRVANIDGDRVSAVRRTLVKGVGGQGTLNVNSWSPDSTRFAYVTYEAIP